MANGGNGKLLITAGNFYQGRLDAVYDLLKRPNTVMGLGDGGGALWGDL